MMVVIGVVSGVWGGNKTQLFGSLEVCHDGGAVAGR